MSSQTQNVMVDDWDGDYSIGWIPDFHVVHVGIHPTINLPFLDPKKSYQAGLRMVVAKTLHKDELQGSSEPVPPSKPSWCGHGEVRISTETELRI